MKVCMISGLAKFSGGLENVVSELSNFLINHDEEVRIFGRSNRDFIESKRRCRIIGVHPYSILPHGLGIPHYDKYVYSLKTWKKTKTFGPYDIIHGHGDNCFFSALFRDKTPFLMTFHGTMAKTLQRSEPRTLPIFYTEKVAASRCDIAVACSKAVKKEMIQFYGTDPKKIIVIYNGVNVQEFAPIDKKEARRKLGLPEHNKYALWVGGNPLRKRLSTAIKAVEKSKCSKLLVVGMTGRNVGKTIYLGKIPKYDLIAAYSAADLLLFPTIYEGFPMVPLEALACGLPTIVSGESNLGEIIEENIHGFVVKNGNSDYYQEKIDLLIDDETKLENMSIECRRLALNYSWQKQAEKYWLVYQKLLENR